MVFVDVAWADEFEAEFGKPIRDSIVVLVDTFRATTVIPLSLYTGAEKLIVLKDTKTARKYKAENPCVILAGENGGIMRLGFDTGNSPHGLRALLSDPINKGKTIVLNTGNFSKVLEETVEFIEGQIIIAGLVNRQSVVDYILKKSSSVKSIYFVATGTYYMHGERYDIPLRTLEDLFGGLTVLKKLVDDDGMGLNLSERADHYLTEYHESIKDDESLVKALWDTHYAKYLLELDEIQGNTVNKDDIKVCVEIDTCPVVPVVGKNNGLLECTAPSNDKE